MTKFVKSVKIQDKYGAMHLFMSGRVFIVDHGTRVLVIDVKTVFSVPAYAKVRILEGDYTGASGWLPIEFVAK